MLQNTEKLSHEGVISKIVADTVFVSIVQTSACSGCHAKGICNASDKKEKIIEVSNVSEKLNEGDRVSVECSQAMGLSAVFYAFVIPLLLIIITLFVAMHLSKSDTIAAICSVGVLAFYLGILYICKNKFKRKFVFTLTKKEIDN
ncbi:SoxR reducing system RseC family protein [Viscerimonas tarda]